MARPRSTVSPAAREPAVVPDGQLHPPHDPYVARRQFWNLYEDCPALDAGGADPLTRIKIPHSRRLYNASDYTRFDIRPEHVRRARRAYFAKISYIDEKIGELLERRWSACRYARRTRSSSSAPTMAICWASAACGSR